MGLRFVFYIDFFVIFSVDSSIVFMVVFVQSMLDFEESRFYGDDVIYLVEGGRRQYFYIFNGFIFMEMVSFKKKCFKFVDIWWEDSLEFLFFDLS